MSGALVPSPRKRLKGRLEIAYDQHQVLVDCASRLTLERLSKPQYHSRICWFTDSNKIIASHMGRELTADMIKLLDWGYPGWVVMDDYGPLFDVPEDATYGDLRTRDSLDEYGFHHITGIPGIGKTTSLRAAVVYLYAQYATSRSGGESGSGLACRRIMMLDGAQLAKDVFWHLAGATMQAYSDTPEVCAEIEGLTDMDEFFMFFERRVTREADSIIVVVDDGNRLPRSHTAVGHLRTLCRTCRVVFCASVSSEWLDVIRHPKTKLWDLIVGGFQAEETESYTAKLQGTVDYLDKKLTGDNPMLITQYAMDMESFGRSTDTFRSAIDAFLDKVVTTRVDLHRVLAASLEVPKLTEFLETKAFYQHPETKTLACVTEDLRGYALMSLVERTARRDDDEHARQVRLWMDPIVVDDNMVRIGWNTEMAALLAMAFFPSNVYYDTNKFVPWKVYRTVRFTGEMARKDLSKHLRQGEGTLHLPAKCNHKGVDAVYEDQDHIVCIQVTVARNPESHHPHTVVKAESLFHGDTRVKLLLWLVYTDRWCSYFVKPGQDYYYVTMPFVNMSEMLRPIDDRLKALRGRPREDVCSFCYKSEGDTAWKQCDFCDLYYHESCVASWPQVPSAELCRRGIRVVEADKDVMADPSLTAHPPFECLACSGLVKLKKKAA